MPMRRQCGVGMLNLLLHRGVSVSITHRERGRQSCIRFASSGEVS